MAGLMMKYFVLKPSSHGWHGEACRAALEAYENIARQNGETEFAEDLRLWRAKCAAQVADEQRDHFNYRSGY